MPDHRRRRRELEAEERARQQVAVRFRDEQTGKEWTEIQSRDNFWAHSFRDSESKRRKGYSAKSGYEDKMYEVVDVGQAPPKKEKKKDNNNNNVR
jgi:hypothetical protein